MVTGHRESLVLFDDFSENHTFCPAMKTIFSKLIPGVAYKNNNKKTGLTVSRYVCNQATWKDGNPMLIRAYWFVSVIFIHMFLFFVVVSLYISYLIFLPLLLI